MDVYYDNKNQIWICEAHSFGRTYIGEGYTYQEARLGAINWYISLLSKGEAK